MPTALTTPGFSFMLKKKVMSDINNHVMHLREKFT